MRRAFALAAVLTACGPKADRPPPGPPPARLYLSPACSLAPAAGLSWVVDAKPRAIAEIPDLIPSIALVVPEARVQRFAATRGGVDPRQIVDLCVARYRDATLTIAQSPIDPARVEAAFQGRLSLPGGRAVVVPNPPVVRVWGEAAGEPQELVVFGREAVALEEGRSGPARAATAFALGRLKRAAPALDGAALAPAARLLGEAPLRAFAPGPFDGEMAKGLGGLLRAATAVGASARHAGQQRIAVRLVITGAWGDDAPAAAERLAAALNVVSESGLGHLLGLHQPHDRPRVSGTADALVAEAVLDGAALARGLHDALDADVAEIFRR